MIDAQLLEGPDPRAVSQSHLSERRRLRRRDDVAASVRQAGEAADAGRVRADRRSCARPVGAVALESSRRCRRAQPRRAGADARRRIHHRGAGAGGAGARGIRIRPYPGATEVAQAGYAKDFLRQQFRDQFGGDHPPDWEVRTTFVPELQEMAERAVADGLRRFGDPDLQAALVAIDPRTGDILAMVGGRDFRQSQFNRASRSRRQPGSAFKPFLVCGGARARLLAGVGADGPRTRRAARTRRVGAAQRRGGRARRADAARGADRVEQPRRDDAAAARSDRGRCCGSPPTSACATCRTCRRCRSAPGLVTPLDLTAAFAMFPNGGLAVQPRGIIRVIDADGSSGARQRRSSRARHLAADGVPDGLDARGRHRSRNRVGGAHARACGLPSAARPARPTSSRTPGSSASRRRGGRRVGRLRSAEDDRPRGLRRALRAADLERLHAPRRAAARPARVRGIREACGTSRSAASRI